MGLVAQVRVRVGGSGVWGRRGWSGVDERHHARLRALVDNARILAALGPQGFLGNVARGSVVDEAALIDALQTHDITASRTHHEGIASHAHD